MQTSTNRRGALAALAKAAVATGALSVACAVSQCSTKAEGATINRSAWDRALALVKATENDHLAAIDRHDKALTAYYQDRPDVPALGRVEVGDTVDRYNARQRELRSAYANSDTACRRIHRVDETDTEQTAACNAACAAVDALIAIPAPDFEACAVKLEIAINQGLGADELGPVVRDIRALAKGGLI